MTEPSEWPTQAAYRAMWISDTHLGAPEARVEDLLHFLEHHDADLLYLVGDIVDIERMRRRPAWPAAHARAAQMMLDRCAGGRRVIYIPGNHDAAVRALLHLDLSGVEIWPWAVHATADGRRLLVTHGDTHDDHAARGAAGKAVCYAVHGAVHAMVRGMNRRRDAAGQPRLAVGPWFRRRVPAVRRYVERYEQALAAAAARHELDGVVCGHIHCPVLRPSPAPAYYNCGDWIDHATAIVETAQGELRLLDAEGRILESEPPRPSLRPSDASHARGTDPRLHTASASGEPRRSPWPGRGRT